MVEESLLLLTELQVVLDVMVAVEQGRLPEHALQETMDLIDEQRRVRGEPGMCDEEVDE